MRAEFIQRLKNKGVTIDAKVLEGGKNAFDQMIGARIASSVFGDSTAKRKYLVDDNQLERAIEVLQQAPNQQALFAIAEHENKQMVAVHR
jgi:hypothetical protein